MTEILHQQQSRTATADQHRQLYQLGNDAAALCSAMSDRAAVVVRAELFRLVAMFERVPRPADVLPDGSISPEIHRIAEGMAAVFRATPPGERRVLLAHFITAARKELAADEYAARWVCALRESE